MLYLVLAATGVASFIYNLRRGPAWLVVCVTVTGCLFIGTADLISHDLMGLYEFDPNLLQEMAADEHLGLVLADLVFIPGSMSYLATTPPRRRPLTAVILAACVTAIEAFFHALGLFDYNGWRLWFTPVLFTLQGLILTWWAGRLERHGYVGLFRTVVILGAITQLVEPWANISTGILGTWAIHPHLAAASLPDKILGLFLIYQTPIALMITLTVALGWARTVWGYLLVGGALWTWLSLPASTRYLQHAAAWNPFWEVAAIVPMAWLVARLDRYLLRVAGGEQVRAEPYRV